MYLEKLEIQGFKSFANKNKLIFPGMLDKTHRGITGIVGPNGSGKSNVADAIRWALGEQSIKTLRGKKSEDVIFSGSDKKGQLGMAEVSLYLNNSDRKIKQPLLIEEIENKEAPDENISEEEKTKQVKTKSEESIVENILSKSEIILTRRIYRDGNSEYLINNVRARLTDVQMLLAKANFGQKTYSVIGQGLVEGFLNTSLAERKDFFDEATGVKQYQIKRDIALNKLQGSYENLNQVEILLNEIEPRLKSLTRQVEKLKKRSELEESLGTIQIDYYRQSWHELNDRFHEYNAKFLDLEKVKAEKEDKMATLNVELSQIENQPSIGTEFNELQAKISELRNNKDNLGKQLWRLESWLKLQVEMPNFGNPKELEAQKEEVNTKITVLQTELETIKQGEVDNQTLTAQRNLVLETQSASDRIEKEIAKLNAWLEMKMESQGQFDLSFLNNKKQELEKESLGIDEEINQNQNFIETKKLKAQQLVEDRNRLSNQISELNRELMKVSLKVGDDEINKINAQLQSSLHKLVAAEAEMDIAKVRLALNEIRAELQEILDLSTGSKSRSTLEKLQKELSGLTDDKENLANEINTLNLEVNGKQQLSRMLSDKKQQNAKELDGISKKLIQSQTAVNTKDVEKQRDDLSVQAEELNKKLQSAKETLSKTTWEAEARRDQLFSKQREIQYWQGEMNKLNNELNDIRLNHAKFETRLEDLESSLRRYKLTEDLENINEVNVRLEEKTCRDKMTFLNQEITTRQAKIDQFNAEQETKRHYLLSLQKNIQGLQMEINGLSNQLNDLKIQATRQETKLEDLENNIRANNLDIQKIRADRTAIEIDMARAAEEIGRLRHQLEQIGGIDPEVSTEYENTKERYDFLFGQTTDLNGAIKSLEKIIYELDVTIKAKFDVEFDIISEKFTEYFKILFNGGNARIVKVMASDEAMDDDSGVGEETQKSLTADEKAQLNYNNSNRLKFLKRHNATGLAGIEIEATPPGKKIKSISMLSGGERALTAIALISAIISNNPSPFVVLDEVDAALDEANSERLAKILDDLSNKTQFIVITHNRAPMRKASVLYGITMQADGISQLLSVKLDDIKMD
ncbi:MAG: AAA family ATPase [Candidatus Falkowbacteria bacterium]